MFDNQNNMDLPYKKERGKNIETTKKYRIKYVIIMFLKNVLQKLFLFSKIHTVDHDKKKITLYKRRAFYSIRFSARAIAL